MSLKLICFSIVLLLFTSCATVKVANELNQFEIVISAMKFLQNDNNLDLSEYEILYEEMKGGKEAFVHLHHRDKNKMGGFGVFVNKITGECSGFSTK